MVNMFGFKNFCILVLCVIAVCKCENNKDVELNESYCDGTGWIGYKDEKCFKLVNKPLTREEAKNVCDQEASQLVSIKSAAEQEYLTEFVFDTSAVVVNIWIGAKRLSGNNFAWDDGTKVDFANWAEDSPTSDAQRGCILMQSDFTREFSSPKVGKWKDVTCEQWNYVVCEKLQKWSFEKFQRTLLNTRKDLTDSLEQVNNELNVTKNQLDITQNQLSTTQNDLSQTKTRLSNAENQIEDSKRNSVPIGFIYVQLPKERTPTEIWPLMQWTEVSATYAGVFFRVNGGGAAAFGQIQEESSPRLGQVRTGSSHSHPPNTSFRPYNTYSPIPKTGWSDAIPTGDGCCANTVFTAFEYSVGEIRPRNMAIRVWKRTG